MLETTHCFLKISDNDLTQIGPIIENRNIFQ